MYKNLVGKYSYLQLRLDPKYYNLFKNERVYGSLMESGVYGMFSCRGSRYGHRNSVARVIMELEGYNIQGKMVDHINGDTLDNRVSNLRVVEQPINNLNSKLYNREGLCRGVCWKAKDKRYEVNINYEGKRYYLGQYKDLAVARDIHNYAVKMVIKRGRFYNSISIVSLRPLMTESNYRRLLEFIKKYR